MKRKTTLWLLVLSLLIIPGTLVAQTNSTRNNAQAVFQLLVDSNVRGSDVYVNNSLKGRTPLRLSLPGGVYTLKVSKQGFGDWQQVVNLNQNITIQANLSGNTAPVQQFSLQVASNQRGATVFINGSSAGVTPFRTTLSAGIYDIRVSKNGFADWQQSVNLNQNLNIQANLQAALPTFQLQIQSNIPTAQIYVNNSLAGQGQVTQLLQGGTYQVLVQAPGYQPYETVVNLNRNQVVSAQLMMATGTVNITIPGEILDMRNGNPAAQVKILVDGAPMNSLAFQLIPGNHQITVTSGGFMVTQMLNVQAGQVYNLNLFMGFTVNGR